MKYARQCDKNEHLLEVKNPDAKGGATYNSSEGELTEGQVKWWSTWLGKRPVVVHTAAEALTAIGAAS